MLVTVRCVVAALVVVYGSVVDVDASIIDDTVTPTPAADDLYDDDAKRQKFSNGSILPRRLTSDELHHLISNRNNVVVKGTVSRHMQENNEKTQLLDKKLDSALIDLIINFNDRVPIQGNKKYSVRTVGKTALVDVVVNTPSADAEETEQVVMAAITAAATGDSSSSDGYTLHGCDQRVCSLYVPIAQIYTFAAFPQIAAIRTSTPIRRQRTTSTTTTTTTSQTKKPVVIGEGVHAMYVDKAATKYATVNGTGITIGVMSISFDCDNDARRDSRRGELPQPFADITILADFNATECDEYGDDEGRAMMQLIYDIAPGAKLVYRTAARGLPDFANGIRELANIGCDIIVDDIGYLENPFVQDGLVAQAVDDVVSQRGVAFFSAAGNDGRSAWDGSDGFVRSGVFYNNSSNNITITGEYHQFGTNRDDGSPILSQRIRFSSTEEEVYFVFQWDEPNFSVSGGSGCTNDVNIFFTYNNTRVVVESFTENVGNDPYERFVFSPLETVGSLNIKDSFMFVDMYIVLSSGTPPGYMKLMSFAEEDVVYEFGNGATVLSHSNSALGAGVGAARYRDTPAYGVAPPLVRSYSSLGGSPIVIDKFGNRQAKEIRQQPLMTGPDDVLTTFFGSSRNRFSGTSASAPQVAAVAALLLQAKGGPIPPKELYTLLQKTAIDMDDPYTDGFDVGYDYRTGSGLVNALGALDAVTCTLSWNLFNSNTNRFVAQMLNNTVITNPPPCDTTNIEVVVPCGTLNPVVIELYQGATVGNQRRLLRRQSEVRAPYFVFGNHGADDDINDGRIPPGKYSIRAMVDGIFSPHTIFVIRGGNCKQMGYFITALLVLL